MLNNDTVQLKEKALVSVPKCKSFTTTLSEANSLHGQTMNLSCQSTTIDRNQLPGKSATTMTRLNLRYLKGKEMTCDYGSDSVQFKDKIWVSVLQSKLSQANSQHAMDLLFQSTKIVRNTHPAKSTTTLYSRSGLRKWIQSALPEGEGKLKSDYGSRHLNQIYDLTEKV